MSNAPGIDFGTPTLELAGPTTGLRLSLRVVVVTAALLLVALCTVVMLMTTGDFTLTPGEVLQALVGAGEPFNRVIVLEWRLPTALAALVFGGLLGLGGAIFQSLTRNPLGSPDIIGFDAGSYSAVLVLMLVVGTSDYWSIAVASVAGGLVVAALVYALAYRRGMQGFRLIIVGIGIASLLGSVNSYLMSRADLDDAMAVGFWSAGTLSRTSWASMVPAMVLALVIAVCATALAPSLRQLELGDDAAVSHGVSVTPRRLALMVVGVATTAVVTAAAGPIGFVALAAPQLARRATGSAGVGLGSAAAMGALLLTLAQGLSVLCATHGRPVPVGLVTVCVGGAYFVVLLIRETRKAGRA
ncbi:iron chelate uptake ABC transporter family permease subunit [Kocuria sp.]|uniref:FecCD family ABC transporter permease n=1 Tax=Kocuria sp. TaxID=1871328 RepID=UPI0026DCE0B7|nr:iron chelate uptake ABC transporter family permease subunit [Kocuria sp.]MDO4920145.1 iron chelate uptake ABC transporter family permease subunit [Kocuria sp.]